MRPPRGWPSRSIPAANVEHDVQVAYMAEVEPYEIAELSGLSMRRVMETLTHRETGYATALRRRNVRRTA